MDVAKNALRIRGFAAAGISVACMLAAACLAAGVPCNQVAYASETESQSQTANAQNAQSSSYLYAVRDSETNLWGFVDAAGTQVIPCQFESLGSLPGQSPSLVTTYSPNNGAILTSRANGLSSPNTSKLACSAMGLTWCTPQIRAQVS